jgi:hypothetical protein
MSKQTPIVLQLQALAIDSNSEVPDLLRKALLIAVKLRLDDFKAWVNAELSGYQTTASLPEYRMLGSRLKAKNPMRGWIPVQFEDHEMLESLQQAPVFDPIDRLAHLMTQGDGSLMYPFSAEAQAMLMRLQPGFSFEIVRFITRSQIAGVIAEVRNRILNWSLDLEEKGIIGEGLTFSEAERAKASMTHSINIGNFQGVLGDVTSSTLHQQLSMTFEANDLGGLREHLRANGVDDVSLAELERALQDDPKPTSPGKFGAKVAAWMGSMLQKAATGAWTVSLGAAGNLLATAIGHYYGLPAA